MAHMVLLNDELLVEIRTRFGAPVGAHVHPAYVDAEAPAQQVTDG
jgi:hypothetical protein